MGTSDNGHVSARDTEGFGNQCNQACIRLAIDWRRTQSNPERIANWFSKFVSARSRLYTHI
ncbi:MAG: hypothetical protein N838_05830 [Thiohalocapsa sp. PB-PSB1]|jgi:hypothetical protein|nr:MAG: hypothetical protein N838_05830 [Thiohalocapsa sp. PB-PSB1]